MDPKQLDVELTQYIRPQTFPLGVKLLESVADLPPRVRRPLPDLGIKVAICQAIGIARRYGWSLAITREDLSCPLALTPFGFAPAIDHYVEGNACVNIYTRSKEAGARTEAIVPRLPTGRYQAVVIAPLARANFAPDVAVVYGNSAQVMRLVQGALWDEGGALPSLAAGRIDCAEMVVRTFLTGRPHFVLPCSGDRIYGLTADDEMVFSMPFGWAGAVVEGLKGTHTAGIRYPIPTFLRFQAQFPKQYEELGEKIREFEAQQHAPAGDPSHS
ncbi:MAG: DUF169 domain-containing protein [Chloroflexi bacterium]|nr:DUF169 domain-containing protein [Chloroflexota bacterium]